MSEELDQGTPVDDTPVEEPTTPEPTGDAGDDDWSAEDEAKWIQEQTGDTDVTSVEDVLAKYKALKNQGTGVTKSDSEPVSRPNVPGQDEGDPVFRAWTDPSAQPVMGALKQVFGDALDKPEAKQTKAFIEAIDKAILSDRRMVQQLLSEVASELTNLRPVASEVGYKQLPKLFQDAFPKADVDAYMKKNNLRNYSDAVQKMGFANPDRLSKAMNGGGQNKNRPANFGTQARSGNGGGSRKSVEAYFVNGTIPQDSPYWKEYGKDAVPQFMATLRRLTKVD